MAVTQIKVNGTFIAVSAVRKVKQREGVPLTVQNASKRFALRAVKSTWELSGENVDAADIAVLETAYDLASTFTFIDETNTSYTVLCMDEPLTIETNTQEQDLSAMYYNFSMTVTEA